MKTAKLMTKAEAHRYTGAAWLETWLAADDAEGDPEQKLLTPCGACLGNLALPDGCFTGWNTLKRQYNRPYGMRLWKNAVPTEAQQEAAPWAKG